MSTYLDLAEIVLKTIRRPLSAKSILRHAYLLKIAPAHLYGRTQHKTLQARLSEDILYNRGHTRFVRTRPGRFFLQELVEDISVPDEFKQTMIARRRKRDLTKGPALSVLVEYVDRILDQKHYAPAERLISILNHVNTYQYFDYKHVPNNYATVWSAAIVSKGNKMLAYRAGRYRNQNDDTSNKKDDTSNKKTVLFTSLVTEDDHTLFDLQEFGIATSAMMAVAMDLDIPFNVNKVDGAFTSHMSFFFRSSGDDERKIITCVNVRVPDWFEPNVNRLSMHDLRWIEADVVPNDIHDFDVWSTIVLSNLHGRQSEHG